MTNENGDIEISVTEENDEILEGFTLEARRKRLRRLKDIAALNVARYLDCEGDLNYLILLTISKPIVKKFLIIYSGDYIININQN